MVNMFIENSAYVSRQGAMSNEMEESTNRLLQQVAEDKLNNVLDFLEQDLPVTVSVHGMVKSLCEWSRKSSCFQLKVYCIDGDANNGCILCHGEFSKYSRHFILYSRESENPVFLNLLKGFDFSCDDGRMLMFQSVIEKNKALANELFKVKNLDLLPHPNYNFWLPPEKCENIQIECPQNLYIGFLNDVHAEVVNNSWPHKFDGSVEYILETINLNFGLGLFRKMDKKLVSFGLYSHYGGISMLFTLSECRRQGYAAIIILSISKELVSRGQSPHAYILHDNKPSAALFRNLGFKMVDSITWYTSI